MDLVVNHVGLTVADLDRSTEFYTALGGEVVGGDRFDGPHMDRGLGVEGVDLHVRMVRFGSVVLELLQYVAPPGQPWTGRNNDVGASHLAFTVDDIQAVHATLVAEGVEFYSDPIEITTGAFAGGFFVYAKDPDGVTVEFLQAGPAVADTAR
ncbi:VOC family protein [Amycolatopsis thermoflava]|uniref:Catechol 2,3-dioxygenase-like lactoylglutathione lyase family enzyme n=1 Tax=Amycolatopsis thermoflava TaxID=84480 RepID=A0A3N2GPF4_9PSEU|nr:VOC family protein [Amycolatopsis thermoflava]ROS38471.1 catechol 2,3-dioxygenase-like lactoylglutathione lyase family enzyme [Amycolatopsis thermoflava]